MFVFALVLQLCTALHIRLVMFTLYRTGVQKQQNILLATLAFLYAHILRTTQRGFATGDSNGTHE